MAFCSQCGSRLDGSPRFCDQCGVPLTPSEAPTDRGSLQQDQVTIGRAGDNVICVPWEAPGVSRYHARVAFVGERMFIEDLGTPNGTWINGVRVLGPTSFTLADEIRLGNRYLLNKAQILAARLDL